MVLATPSAFETTSGLEVRLTLLPSAKPLKSGARVHFHAFTSETVATFIPSEGKALAPGADAFAQIRLNSPVLLVPGDRFIVRQFSPVVTIGGGVVLENAPPARIKDPASRRDFLKLLMSRSREQALQARVTSRGVGGLKISAAVARTGWTPAEIVSAVLKISDVRKIKDVLIQNDALELVQKSLVEAVGWFHKQNPLAAGVPKESLRERLTGVEPEVFGAVFQERLEAGEIETTGELVRLPGRGVTMNAEEAASRKIIEQAFAAAGLKVPALKDVLAGLRIDRTRAQKIITLLLREKVLIKVSDDLVFHHDALYNLRQKLAVHKARSPKIDIGAFKDLAEVSRKYAIPLLEYLDRERVTKRVGDSRVIL